MTTPSPYEPPRAELETKKENAPTVGYLVGGVLQLALGGFLTIRNAIADAPSVSIFGLFLLLLGVRTLIKYRARTRK
jgi:uncharacterized membrane protein HdeD (DUF308 family)